MMRIDNAAMLAAQIAEAAVIGDHGEVGGFRRDLGLAHRAGIGALDELAQGQHVGAKVIMHLPQMQPRRPLGIGQAFKFLQGWTRGVVEKIDIEQHGRLDGAMIAAAQDGTVA